MRNACERRVANMMLERDSWVSHWRDIADHMRPYRSRFLASQTNRGDRRNKNIIDNTGVIVARVLSAGMMSGMSSPARPWFKLEPKDLELMEYGPVKNWLSTLEELVRRIFHASNVYNALPTMYDELGLFGTAATLIEDDYDTVIRLCPFTIGEYALAADNRRQVDTLARKYRMTIMQIVGEFVHMRNGEMDWSAVSSTIKTMWDNSNYDAWVDVCHIIEPNTDADYNKIDNKNMPFRSLYWEENRNDITGNSGFLRQSGYPHNPIIAPRWDVTGYDVYGHSPGMDALGDVRQLQMQQKDKSFGIKMHLRPPTQGPASLQDRFINPMPGQHTVVSDPSGNGGIRPIYEVRPELSGLLEDIEDVRERVRQAFYYHELKPITEMEGVQPRNEKELAERSAEALSILGPVVERLQNEMHARLIERTLERINEASLPFWKRGENGMLPPPPDELQGMQLSIVYISLMAQAQKAAALAGLDRTANKALAFAQFKPDVFDKFDTDQYFDALADAEGLPVKVIRSDDEVEAMRQQRQQQEQMAQMANAMPAVKDATMAAKNLAETPVGGGEQSALDMMMQQGQQGMPGGPLGP